MRLFLKNSLQRFFGSFSGPNQVEMGSKSGPNQVWGRGSEQIGARGVGPAGPVAPPESLDGRVAFIAHTIGVTECLDGIVSLKASQDHGISHALP